MDGWFSGVTHSPYTVVLVSLVLISAFFSGSETAMMALSRYRMKHQSETHHRARLILRLLGRPDRLLGVILIGNTFANILASSLATILAIRWFGESLGIPAATIGLTLTLLVFSEVAPKTLAAIRPERFAFVVVYPLLIFYVLLYPLVWVINGIANTLLAIFGIQIPKQTLRPVSQEELRTIVHESNTRHVRHRGMLLGLLDLQQATVEEIMVPRSEIVAIDCEDPWTEILERLTCCQHTLLPLCRGHLNDIVGVLHVRSVLNLLANDRLTPETLSEIALPPYFVPEGTTLNQQLVECQKNQERMALVVDEYGDIQGLLTLEDILEEVIGEFTTDAARSRQDIHPQPNGEWIVDGSITLRELNRAMNWTLTIQEEGKTLSGRIILALEMIPPIGTCCLIEGIPMEVVAVQDNTIRTVRIRPNAAPGGRISTEA